MKSMKEITKIKENFTEEDLKKYFWLMIMNFIIKTFLKFLPLQALEFPNYTTLKKILLTLMMFIVLISQKQKQAEKRQVPIHKDILEMVSFKIFHFQQKAIMHLIKKY